MTEFDTSIDAKTLKLGDVFYECWAGFNIAVEVVTEPTIDEDNMLVFVGKKVYGGKEVQYTFNQEKGFGHYNPHIFSKPEYFSVKSGRTLVFKDISGEIILEEEF